MILLFIAKEVLIPKEVLRDGLSSECATWVVDDATEAYRIMNPVKEEACGAGVVSHEFFLCINSGLDLGVCGGDIDGGGFYNDGWGDGGGI